MVHMLRNEREKDQLQSIMIESEKKQRRAYITVRILQGILAILLISVVLFLRTLVGQAQLQQGIADEIIRFHVLANSDSKEDQQLKWDVKNKITSYLQDKLKKTTTKEEAEQIIKQQANQLQKIAEEEIKEQGYSYPVTVKLENCYFPVKQYGDLVFPAGEYEALRVLIGNAKGKNWWCVMFPSLCFVNETYSVVPDDSKDKLKHVLNEEEYEAIDQTKEQMQNDLNIEEKEEEQSFSEPQITVRFHFVDVWNRLWD